MNSSDFAWMFVRAFGIYFAYHAIGYLFSIASIMAAMATMYSMVTESSSASDAVQSTLQTHWFRLAYVTAEGVLSSVLAYYCLFRGALIHKLITYRLAPSE